MSKRKNKQQTKIILLIALVTCAALLCSCGSGYTAQERTYDANALRSQLVYSALRQIDERWTSGLTESTIDYLDNCAEYIVARASLQFISDCIAQTQIAPMQVARLASLAKSEDVIKLLTVDGKGDLAKTLESIKDKLGWTAADIADLLGVAMQMIITEGVSRTETVCVRLENALASANAAPDTGNKAQKVAAINRYAVNMRAAIGSMRSFVYSDVENAVFSDEYLDLTAALKEGASNTRTFLTYWVKLSMSLGNDTLSSIIKKLFDLSGGSPQTPSFESYSPTELKAYASGICNTLSELQSKFSTTSLLNCIETQLKFVGAMDSFASPLFSAFDSVYNSAEVKKYCNALVSAPLTLPLLTSCLSAMTISDYADFMTFADSPLENNRYILLSRVITRAMDSYDFASFATAADELNAEINERETVANSVKVYVVLTYAFIALGFNEEDDVLQVGSRYYREEIHGIDVSTDFEVIKQGITAYFDAIKEIASDYYNGRADEEKASFESAFEALAALPLYTDASAEGYAELESRFSAAVWRTPVD